MTLHLCNNLIMLRFGKKVAREQFYDAKKKAIKVMLMLALLLS